jgi:hypothetical protein
MTKKEVISILNWGSSHIIPIPGLPLGVTKFQSFLSIHRMLKGKLYWYALRNAYDMSDNLYQYRYDLRNAFLSQETEREYLMTKKERDYLNKLPEQITIFRGMTEQEYKSNELGISWTIKKSVAEYFVNIYPRNYATNRLKKVICELTIPKSEVIAFFNQRKEFEVIYIKDKDERKRISELFK